MGNLESGRIAGFYNTLIYNREVNDVGQLKHALSNVTILKSSNIVAQCIDKIKHLLIVSFLIGCMMLKWARRVNAMKCRSLLEKKQLHALHNPFLETVSIVSYGTNRNELLMPLVKLSVSIE